MLKILQARLQQDVNRELPDVQALLEKAEELEIKLPTSAGSWKKQKSSRKNIYFCFIDYAKSFDCVDHNRHITSVQIFTLPLTGEMCGMMIIPRL